MAATHSSYLPRADAELVPWLENFATVLDGFSPDLEVPPEELAAINAGLAAFKEARDLAVSTEALLASKFADRDAKREAVVSLVRAMVARIQANPAATDAMRRQFGITVRDTQATPAGAPATRPLLQVDVSELYRLTISFCDEATPTRRARPPGVMGILLQYKKGGEMPVADADWRMLAIDTNSPYTAIFDLPDAGQPIWLRGCWLSTRQDRGPWSATSAARVPG